MAAVLDHSRLFQTIDEHPEPIIAEVKGNLPSWLTGTLIRNGPGRFECGDTSFNHWFDGQGLLHRFHIQNGNVTYNNKFIRSDSYADSLKHGESIHLEFGSYIPPDPCQNIFKRFFSRFWADEVPMDNTLVNVFPMKDKIYATTESNFLFEINPETLDTLKRIDITKEFPGKVINRTYYVTIFSKRKGPFGLSLESKSYKGGQVTSEVSGREKERAPLRLFLVAARCFDRSQ